VIYYEDVRRDKKTRKTRLPTSQKNPQKSFCHSAPGALFSAAASCFSSARPTDRPPTKADAAAAALSLLAANAARKAEKLE